METSTGLDAMLSQSMFGSNVAGEKPTSAFIYLDDISSADAFFDALINHLTPKVVYSFHICRFQRQFSNLKHP